MVATRFDRWGRCRLTLAFSLAVAVGLVPLAAAAAPPAASWALSPVGRYDYTLTPGATAAGSLEVTNGQDQAQVITLYAADLAAIAGGGFTPVPPGAPMDGVGAWLHLSAITVSVPAGGSTVVPFTVAVPFNQAPGQYDGAIVAAAAAVAAGGGGMGTSARTALTVQVSVPLATTQIQGGQETDLTTPAGGLAVVVPPGALPVGATLALTPAAGAAVPLFPPLPSGATEVLGPLRLRALDPGGASLRTPSRSLAVSVQPPVGTPTAGLLVLEFDPALRAWLPRPTQVRDGALLARLDRVGGIAVATDPALSVYPDVVGAWDEAPVLALESLGVVSGYPDGSFRPTAPVTRAEFALLLQRALRLPPGPASALSGFADATSSPPWAVPALAAAVDAGLLAGQADGILAPNDDLSRGAAAVIAARALGLSGGPAVSFTDAGAVPAWAQAGTAATVAAGLLEGYPDGSFRPLQPVTRGEAAALILRLLRWRAA